LYLLGSAGKSISKALGAQTMLGLSRLGLGQSTLVNIKIPNPSLFPKSALEVVNLPYHSKIPYEIKSYLSAVTSNISRIILVTGNRIHNHKQHEQQFRLHCMQRMVAAWQLDV
jgi:hypothetical protein